MTALSAGIRNREIG
jgi:small nuclear ribonucleoprotein B and B'